MVHKSNLEKAIDKVVRRLGPEVVRIRYNLDEDWTGEPAIFFRVVLTDSAARDPKRRGATQKVIEHVFDDLQPQGNWGRYPYFNFLSKSDSLKINDPAWN